MAGLERPASACYYYESGPQSGGLQQEGDGVNDVWE